ncbi:AAA family ATPase [Oceanospirillum sediminis]|uniref:ATP-binding protein n=1 Tax=Oceanospirillum sediminis TaxID=2760088 RepID=A0A839IWR4_9GAMM|nr:AAA family ATPase [Oceanospirillum sediminis]MBB1489398.1 ATP-binding protein [Oceanospirillum sediminis]
MKLLIKNLGIISRGEVKIDGLTVIAGENDAGKSTVGKLFFSLIKAISRYKEDVIEDKDDGIAERIEDIYITLRRLINVNENTVLKETFNPNFFYREVREDELEAVEYRIDMLESLQTENKASRFILKGKLIRKLNNLKDYILEPTDKESIIRKAISKSLYSEFKGGLFPAGQDENIQSGIFIKDGESEVVDILWGKEKVDEVCFYDDVGLGFKDVTFVDDTSVLQYHELFLYDNAVGGAEYKAIPFHARDLSEKLKIRVFDELLTEYRGLSRSLSDIYKGNMQYNRQASDFFLDRGNYKIPSANVATGIKSLGILDLLIKSGACNSDNLLILDEPEVNLHPKWQIEVARVIVGLVSQGAKIIITTHSPYMLEALEGFSRMEALDSNFYLAKKINGTSEIVDVSGDVGIVVEQLAQPLFDLHEELERFEYGSKGE